MSTSSLRRCRLLVAFVLWIVPAAVYADTVTLAWDASEGATGYTVRWGTALGSYPSSADAGNNTTFAINGLTAGGTYWAVVQAYNSTSVSDYSTPLQFTVATTACTYSISPGSVTAPATATSGTIVVTTPTACAWSAVSASSFLTIQNGTGRAGSGSVTFTMAANTGTTARTATATVAGHTFTVSQAAASCTYSITPATTNVGDAATSGSVTVTTQSGCPWSATSASSFLTFSNGSGRSGSGTVSFSMAANTGTTARTATATIAGKSFTVSQAATACTYSINPATMSVSDGAASGTITVTTQAGCAWSASSASTFLTFPDGSGRVGTGTVTFSIGANTATTARTATGTVAGQTFTVSQSAAPQVCSYSITPANGSAPAAGSNGTITVTTQAGCAWSASSATSFLTFSDGTGRTGTGTVSYVVAPNSGAFRTAMATVAGKGFTLWQAAVTACTYAISPATVNAGAAAATGSVTVSTQSGCGWNAVSLHGALTFQDGSGRTGPGSVTFTAAENTGVARNVLGLVAGATFTVAQAAGAAAPPSTEQTWSSDFDGDGKNDLLVRDVAVGTVEAWFLDNATVKGKQILSDTLDPNWMLVGRGDFNGDGRADIVWQHKTDGRLAIWYMDGTTRVGLDSPSIILIGDPGWTIVGVGDFNADGHADLVWQHIDGSVGVWLMTESSVNSTPNFLPDRATDLLWKVVGVADFNGDGKSDLLWRHSGTGELGAWLMNGLSRIIHSPLNPFSVPDQRWQVGAVIDANGDGKADIVWHHTDGTVMIWHMNGTSRVTYPILPSKLPVGWTLAGPK